MDQRSGCIVFGIVGVVLAAGLLMLGWPQYRVYSQRLAGEAALAEAGLPITEARQLGQ